MIYTSENGRIYCGNYYLPVDDEELDRQRITHQVQLTLLNGSPTTVDLTSPTKILDIGTGTGEWAMEMGDLYPSAEVIGTDIAKIQPSAAPLNVFFEIDDAEEEDGWTWPANEFDLVHLRNMSGAFRDWGCIYREAFECLKPGAWIEICEFDDQNCFQTFYGSDSPVAELAIAFKTAAMKSGRPRSMNHLEPEFVESHGFVDVRTSEYEIPIGIWPEDEQEKSLGKLWLISCLYGTEAFAMRHLTRELGWDPERVHRLCASAVREMKSVALDPERGKGFAFKCRLLVARKPEGAGAGANYHHEGVESAISESNDSTDNDTASHGNRTSVSDETERDDNDNEHQPQQEARETLQKDQEEGGTMEDGHSPI